MLLAVVFNVVENAYAIGIIELVGSTLIGYAGLESVGARGLQGSGASAYTLGNAIGITDESPWTWEAHEPIRGISYGTSTTSTKCVGGLEVTKGIGSTRNEPVTFLCTDSILKIGALLQRVLPCWAVEACHAIAGGEFPKSY
jgi:hypothetical protein